MLSKVVFYGVLAFQVVEQTPTVSPPKAAKPEDDVEDLEKELELDLENMKIDENIDTSVSYPQLWQQHTHALRSEGSEIIRNQFLGLKGLWVLFDIPMFRPSY